MGKNKNKDTDKDKVVKKPRQGHKLVWFTLIIIAIPCVIVGMVLFQSMGTQNTPVVGSRFSNKDLNPSISKTEIKSVKDAVKSNLSGIESIEVNLKSATLRVDINMDDEVDSDTIASAIDVVYEQVNSILPIDQYFTNTEDGKMYDLEINIYNWLVDDSHPDGQIYYQCTKTGAATDRVVDCLTSPKDADLVASITRSDDGTTEETTTEEEVTEEPTEEEYVEEYTEETW